MPPEHHGELKVRGGQGFLELEDSFVCPSLPFGATPTRLWVSIDCILGFGLRAEGVLRVALAGFGDLDWLAVGEELKFA